MSSRISADEFNVASDRIMSKINDAIVGEDVSIAVYCLGYAATYAIASQLTEPSDVRLVGTAMSKGMDKGQSVGMRHAAGQLYLS